MGGKRLWIGGYGPERSSHGAGLATFKRIVEPETEGTSFVDLAEEERLRPVSASAPAISLAHERVPEELFELARS